MPEHATPAPAGRTVADAMLHRPKLHGPAVTVGELREFFLGAHVHAALVVDGARHLLAVVERADLDVPSPSAPAVRAVQVGRLHGRVIRPDAPLEDVWRLMRERGRRRLAVTDGEGLLVGLLALKRSQLGFCSDAGVLARRTS